MDKSLIEKKRNELNLEIRCVLEIIEFIDGIKIKYPDYKSNSMTEEMYLEQQIEIVNSAKERLLKIFKD